VGVSLSVFARVREALSKRGGRMTQGKSELKRNPWKGSTLKKGNPFSAQGKKLKKNE